MLRAIPPFYCGGQLSFGVRRRRMTTFPLDPHKLEELLNYCLGFAKQMVEAHGAFHPFGAVLLPSGTVTAVGADIGEEHPNGADVFRFFAERYALSVSKERDCSHRYRDRRKHPTAVSADFSRWHPSAIGVCWLCSLHLLALSRFERQSRVWRVYSSECPGEHLCMRLMAPNHRCSESGRAIPHMFWRVSAAEVLALGDAASLTLASRMTINNLT